jgi:hypothetical protein
MLTFTHGGPRQTRRDFLKVGTLGLGGLSLSWLLAARARAMSPNRAATGKSVVFLMMHGGPSQVETFDPKMTAADGVRSVTGEVKTSLPGVTFGRTFPKLAALAHKITVVRSYVGAAEHSASPVVHRETLNANMASVYARLAGMNHPATGMPNNIAVFPRSVDPSAQPPFMGLGNFAATGTVGGAYAPLIPGGTGDLLRDLQLTIPRGRLEERRQLLRRLEDLRRGLDYAGTMESLDRIQQQALDAVLRGVAAAFDVSQESPKTVARYDTAPHVRPEAVRKNLGNYKRYLDHGRCLGKELLLARRLCEAGCGFVTVTSDFVWDMHADANNAPVAEAMPYVGAPFDHAVSAFIEDIEALGLSDKILLVATGEMGRTPKVNKGGGRDHWGNLTPLLVYGGGLKMGQVIGRSSANAGEPASEPVTVKHLVATIMHFLLDVGEVRVARGVPDDVLRVVTGGEPIPGLLD